MTSFTTTSTSRLDDGNGTWHLETGDMLHLTMHWTNELSDYRANGLGLVLVVC